MSCFDEPTGVIVATRPGPVTTVVIDYGRVLDDRRTARDSNGSYPLDIAAAAAVGELVGMGQAVMVASGTRHGQTRRQALAPIRHLLQGVLETAQLGCDKTDPQFWAAIRATAAVPPGQVLYVGDRVGTDIRPALAAGMCACLVNPGRRRPADLPQGVPVIDHIRSLPALLRAAAGSRA